MSDTSIARLKSRFFRRVFTRLALLLAAGMFLVCALTWQIAQFWIRSISDEHLIRLAQLSSHQIGERWANLAGGDLETECRQIRKTTGCRATIIDPAGLVLADSDTDARRMENHADRPEVIRALAGERGRDRRMSRSVGIMYVYVAVPVHHEGQRIAVLRTAIPSAELDQSESALIQWIASALAVALPGSLVIAWFLARTLAVPIQRVSRMAERLATGDLVTQITAPAGDEVGVVAESLERMRASLAAQVDEGRRHRRNLEVTLSHLREGVVAADAEGRVLVTNAVARNLLGMPASLVGVRLDELLLRDRSLARLWEDAAAAPKPQLIREVTLLTRDITLPSADGSIRNISASVVRIDSRTSPIAWLLCLRDVTVLARSIAMKTDFVANASHELRTPLASIRAAIETLQSDGLEPDLQRRFLSVIDRAADRLQNLTDDLMQLNRVESPSYEPQITSFDPAGLLVGLKTTFARPLTERSIAFEFRCEVEEIHTDRRSLELILKNLVDNAIKFVSERGRVEVSVRRVDNAISFAVKDDGCGIPAQERERVFERFYQVDKSRSQSQGGTGLGLAIVKHAVLALGGELTLTSELGVGTTVSVTLPIVRVFHAAPQSPAPAPSA